MPGPASSRDPQIGVVVEPRVLADADESLWSGRTYVPSAPDESPRQSVGRMLDHGVDTVVVAGGDALIAAILTAHRRYFRTHPHPLRLFALRAGSFTRVAEQLDAPAASAKTFRRLERAVADDKLDRRLLPTLKVSSSAEVAARLGFSFGAGLFYRLIEAYHRAGPSGGGAVASALVKTLRRMGGEMLTEGSRALEPTSARVAVDGRPRAESVGYLLASSLDASWMGLNLLEDQGLSFRMGQSPGELVREVAKARALPRFMRSAEDAEPFDRIHVDFSGGYVLDGALYEPSKPYVVQIEKGPVAHFLTL